MTAPAEILQRCPACGSCPRGRPRSDGTRPSFERRPADCDLERINSQLGLFQPRQCPVREVLIGAEF